MWDWKSSRASRFPEKWRPFLAERPQGEGSNCLVFLGSGVAAAVARFISFEISGGLAHCGGFIAPLRHIAAVSVLRIVVIVYLALEVFGAVEPWTDADEDAAGEPLRSVVAVGNAVIGGVIVVAVGTIGSDANVDFDLGLGSLGVVAVQRIAATAASARNLNPLMCFLTDAGAKIDLLQRPSP